MAELQFIDGDVRKYKQIRLLDNGWAKCAAEHGGEDYIPPHRIKNVTGTRVFVGNGEAV